MRTYGNRPVRLATIIPSLILLLAMVTGMVHGAFGSVHHHGCDQTISTHQHLDAASTHPCPSCPSHTHDDGDDRGSCMSCSCHAPLTVQQYRLDLVPLFSSDLTPLDAFTHLPEVFLSKFIPPQNPA